MPKSKTKGVVAWLSHLIIPAMMDIKSNLLVAFIRSTAAASNTFASNHLCSFPHNPCA